MLRNIKIGARLIIASSVFLIPVGMTLFFIVTGSSASLRAARLERRGLESLRSIAGLFQAASAHQRMAAGEAAGAAGQKAGLEGEIDAHISALKREYDYLSEHPSEAAGGIGYRTERGAGDMVQRVRAGFGSLEGKDGWEKLAVYSNLVGNLRTLAARAGGDFSLILENEAAGYYLADAGIRVFPQSLERIFLIGNLLRFAQVQESFPGGSFSAGDRKTVADYLILFRNSDVPQALSGMDAALACLEGGAYPVDTGEIYSLLESYRSAAERFGAGLDPLLSPAAGNLNSGPRNDAAYAEVFAAETLVAEQGYKLMSAALDQLDLLLQRRAGLYRGQLIRSLLITIFALILAFAVVVMTNMSISRNIRTLKVLFKTLEGNDLSVRALVKSNDEFGELMTAFNGFLEKLRAAFDTFNRDISTLVSAVFDLSASAREISTTANEQSASVAEILSTMEGNKNLSAQGAAKTQEVAELAGKTRELSRRGADLRDANQDMMGMIRDQNGTMIEEINSLADMLARINESIAIIDSIADQTKLIAFNASLEAAASVESSYGESSAGENARFSVVAAEIRRFADSVVDSTTEIKEQILEVQQASRNLTEEAAGGRRRIDQGYERMVKQKEVFERIVEVSGNVADRSRQISDLSKQQEYASSQIFTALKEISGGVNQFVTATASTSRIADSLNGMSVELRKVLETYRTGSAPPDGQQADGRNGGETI
jgi:methyl-accepting chemotaxis protein